MLSKSTFRLLLLAEVCFQISGLVVSALTTWLLPVELRTYLQTTETSGFSTSDWVVLGQGVIFLAVFFTSRIGLFVFWRRARTLYLVSLFLLLGLTPFFGPYVDAGWGHALDAAALILSGLILALIYFSPLSSNFEVAGCQPNQAVERTNSADSDPT
jgi:hypothetical protein